MRNEDRRMPVRKQTKDMGKREGDMIWRGIRERTGLIG